MFNFIKKIFNKNKGQVQELGGSVRFSKMSSKRAEVSVEKTEKPDPPKDRKVRGTTKGKNYGRKNRNKKFYDKN